MMEEEGESTTPFWLQSSTTTRRRNRRLSSGVVLFTLSITFSLFTILFLIPSLLSLSPQISKPNLFKKSWDSLNITLVLLALIFGLLSRNRNHDLTVEDFQYPDRTVDVDLTKNQNHDPTDNKIRNVVKNPNNMYEYSDPTVMIGLKRSHSSYPDLREIYPNDRWRFHDDTSLNAYPPSGKSSPEEKPKKSKFTNETAKKEVKSVNTGTVLGVGEGIARVRGLDGVMAGEIVEFDEGIIGIVTNSEFTENVGVLLMGDGLRIPKGSFVKATGKIAQVPASLGEAGLDRGVEVLINAIDGRDEIKDMPPAVRRRMRRTAGSDGNKGKLSEEVSGMEPPSAKISHRRTKSSGLESSGEKLSHRKTKSNGFERFGTVLLVGNGIARIYGLDEVTEGEIVEFEEGTIGIVMNSESVNNVGVVLMGDGLLIQEGSRVKATGKIAQIPVPDAHLGSVINSLAKPIDDKNEIFASESRLVEEREVEQLPPGVRRRMRRTAGSIAKKGKPSEEVNGFEQLSRRKTKRTHEESIIPKVEAKDELEPNEYESPPEILVQDAPSSPPARSEKKSATRDFLTSFTKKKKKQKQKSVENLDTSPESPPPSPPHPSKSFFSSKKGKSKKFVTVPPPPPPPPPYFASAREQKSAPETAPSVTRRPPLAAKTRGVAEERDRERDREREFALSGAESPMHPIPSPPPPPPFKMPSWKFVVKGDYVRIGSVNSSRSVSPEPDEADSPISSESGSADVAMGTMFCPSPDVNSKADMFIAKFRAGLKLQKMDSMKLKQGVGLSNLGPASTLDQAQA